MEVPGLALTVRQSVQIPVCLNHDSIICLVICLLTKPLAQIGRIVDIPPLPPPATIKMMLSGVVGKVEE